MNNLLGSFLKVVIMSKPIILVVALLSLGAGVWAVFEMSAPTILVSEARLGKIRDSVTGNVRVYAAKTYNLYSQAQAMVDEVALLPMGKPIKVDANQILVQLSKDDLLRSLSRLDVEKKQLSQKQSIGSVIAMELEFREKELKVMEELVNLRKDPAFELEKKLNEVNRLRAQVKLEEIQELHSTQNNQFQRESLLVELEKRSIRSPIDGEFLSSLVAPGNMVFSGNQVGTIHSFERIIEVSLNEEDFNGIKEGLPSAISLFSLGDQVLTALVSSIASSVDPSSGIRKLYLRLLKQANLPVGSSGRAEIITEEKNATLIVPTKALVGGSVLVSIDGRVEFRNVEVGARNLKTVEILKGLKLNEKVVVETPHLFISGGRIRESLVKFQD